MCVPRTEPKTPARAASATTKSAKTKARILDATAYILCRKGFSGTRLTDVADRAECQAPAIYYYYDSREDLIEEVIWQGMTRLLGHVRAALEEASDKTAAERLNIAVEQHLRFILEESDYTMAAIRNAAQMPIDLRDRQLAEQQKYAVLWRQLFSDVRKAGQLRPGVDERLARMLILGSLNWSIEWWQPRGESVGTLVANAKMMLNGGFLKDPEEPQYAAVP